MMTRRQAHQTLRIRDLLFEGLQPFLEQRGHKQEMLLHNRLVERH